MRADWRQARIREQAILEEFGAALNTDEPLTAAELGRKYKISECRAWQIVQKKYGYLRALNKEKP